LYSLVQTRYSTGMSIPIADIPSPCYVLEKELLLGNLKLISSLAEEAGVAVIPALKGFAMWSVFPLMSGYVAGAAASSLNEALLIQREMGRRAHTYAPVFREEEFDGILSASSHLTFNSPSQVRRFLPRLEAYNGAAEPDLRVSWGLRVNPGYSPVETPLYNPASPESRLGLTRRELDEILTDHAPEGLHVHTLCESSAANSRRLIEALQEGFGDLLPSLRWLNLGGGHLMTRKGYDRKLLLDTLRDLRQRYPALAIYLEPGSAFVWETGFLRARVEDIVTRGGVSTAILDVSFTAHMPDCLEMPYQPRIRGMRIAGIRDCAVAETNFRYRMGGNSCLAGDVTGAWLAESALEIGDPVLFEDMIHYTMVKTTMFNGVHHPSIGILDKDGTFSLVREFGYDDYRSRLS
jgi:carboxyaminopropylagmatine decarboxylase